MIRYNILSSGSKGNAVLIEDNILIDCGVPFKTLYPYYKNLQLVLLTHIHSDHFNKATITRLAKERPSLRFICGGWLHGELMDLGVQRWFIDRLNLGESAAYASGLKINMFPAAHDVPNAGYKIFFPNGEKMLYCTDTNDMTGIEAKDFELYMLEANYAESELRTRIAEKQEAGGYVYEWRALYNHLSKEKADDWLYRNMNGKSEFVYMHMHDEK